MLLRVATKLNEFGICGMLARGRKSINISLYDGHLSTVTVHSYSKGSLAFPTLILAQTSPVPVDSTTSLLIVQNQGIILDSLLNSSRSNHSTSPVGFASRIS